MTENTASSDHVSHCMSRKPFDGWGFAPDPEWGLISPHTPPIEGEGEGTWVEGWGKGGGLVDRLQMWSGVHSLCGGLCVHETMWFSHDITITAFLVNRNRPTDLRFKARCILGIYLVKLFCILYCFAVLSWFPYFGCCTSLGLLCSSLCWIAFNL